MIFQNAIWQYPEYVENSITELAKSLDCSNVMAKLYYDRNLLTQEAVNRFLNPSLEGLHDPMLLIDMDLAKARIEQAVEKRESIWIYGDYDVDGITSIVILSKYFEYIGHQAFHYIPSRQDEGYGISEMGIDAIKAQGGQLIITVDCGITAVEQAAYAKSQGIDLIITDHHECQEELPDAIAVVNPKRGGYPFQMLAGCGVALKLAQAMLGDAFEKFYTQIIDIAALGTVADIVPLVDENRIITKIGLEHMNHTSNPGVQALLAEANLTDREVTAGHIGFVIAPRINASGRIGNPTIAVDMLLEKDYFKALEIAKSLSVLNAERQAQERAIMEEADYYIRHHIDLENERILLVVGENWHTGIIGIVASKLTEKYERPAIVLNVEDGMAKGSARSVTGISIFEVLSTFKHYFEKFGGHEQAAGLSFKAENISALKAALYQYGLDNIPKYKLATTRNVNGLLKPQMITHDLVEAIEHLKPFGIGNPKPQFVFENLKIDDYRIIGKTQNHLKLIVNDGFRVYDAIAFNKVEWIEAIRKSDPVHLLINLEKNHFMGVETIQFLIQDLIKDKLPVKPALEFGFQKAFYNYYSLDRHLSFNYDKILPQDLTKLIESEDKDVLIVDTYRGLLAFRDFVMGRNFYRYTLHFGNLDRLESREGYLDVVFMPLTLDSTPVEFKLHRLDEDEPLNTFIPNREDLVYFYKQVFQLNKTNLDEVSKKVRMSLAKVLFCLDLLSEMKLLSYTLFNKELELKFLPKPEQKINLDEVPLFKDLKDALSGAARRK
ncbi:single-stranded-DNA-specific exonuclease RecJ [Fusibacter tunisiensis]|uniref:Single-stranded-DNA-specific exonuclease RecJ n=1 Tax=Fusibacter tunisiensis TaxID=1008308 RepID=A0ABS2MQL2_9FIRM|nr:single-stranded-DNA-specific exonuclease RecJ [Fusibacter tunisiensis]MBM7561617.1 single-stranded-DNA-specific exonuclease [Fusibacter tunisiensis]